MIGHQIKFVFDVIGAKFAPLDAGGGELRASEKLELAQQFSKVVMQILVSVVVLVASLYLLVTSGQEDVRKFASGFIGTVVGYWLR
jgi:hypothetical protein